MQKNNIFDHIHRNNQDKQNFTTFLCAEISWVYFLINAIVNETMLAMLSHVFPVRM